MATQKIVNWSTYNRMRGLLDNLDQIDIYRSGADYPEIADEDMLGTTIALPEEAPVLEVSGQRASNDADNAIKVYEYLGPLTRTQAADSRLWGTLTHTVFWDYCRRRWPINGQSRDYVFDHWFERKGGGLGALRRNAISRLWWAAYLTLAPWEKDVDLEVFKSSDRFKYTRILLSQAQNFQDVLERSYGSNRRLRICLLDALGVYQPKVSNKDDLTKDVSKKLNLLIKHRQLDAMKISDLQVVIDGIAKKSADRLGISQAGDV